MVAALVVLDGLRPDALDLVDTPSLDRFRARGSSTMRARTVEPSVTLPAHLSMLTSVPPAVHGVIDNTWRESGRDHPNLVDQIASAGLEAIAYYTWEPLRDVWAPGSMSATWFQNGHYRPDSDEPVAAAVCSGSIAADFAFVYFGSIDIVGHLEGWMSDAYLRQIEVVDALFGQVVDALGSDATVLALADHGGHDLHHGGGSDEDMIIPWMLAGPEIRPGHAISADVTVLDTAPTLAAVLGLRAPSQWQGRTVMEAFIH